MLMTLRHDVFRNCLTDRTVSLFFPALLLVVDVRDISERWFDCGRRRPT